jgi:hypothetical protein
VHPFRILVFLVLFASPVFVAAQDDWIPFGSDFPPTFTFTETYRETVRYSNAEDDFIDDTLATLSCRAHASMQGLDPGVLTDDETIFLSIGNLSLELLLGDGTPSFADGMNVVRWRFEGTDPDTGDTIQDACTVTLRYNATELIVQLTSSNVPDDFNIGAPDEAGEPGNLVKVPFSYFFIVGPYSMGEQMCYVSGTSALYDTVVNGEEFTDLADVDINGELDLEKPVVRITQPRADDVVDTETIEVSGTVTDNYVAASVDVSLNGGPFVAATLGSNDTWRLTGVAPVPGINSLMARAEDEAGNVDISALRTFVYTPRSRLTLTAMGNAPGKVTGDFISTIDYRPAQPATEAHADLVIGKEFTLVATPGVDALFDHWTSNALLSTVQAASPRLDFTMTENLILTAHFVINPFIPVQGTYAGLLSSTEFGGAGFLSGKVTQQGSFSFKAKIGGLTLPMKGRFSVDGHFSGHFAVGGVSFRVDLTLNVTGAGARTITGAIVRGSQTALVTAELSPFHKKIHPVPGDMVGPFNYLLPASPSVTDPNYPIGIGFGRITISTTGAARFTGKLADGMVVSGGAPLSGERRLPFFNSLYRGRGSISGWITFDSSQVEHDITGILDWNKPSILGSAIHAKGFAGQSDLSGARSETFVSFFNQSNQLTLQSPENDPVPLNLLLPMSFRRGGHATVTITPGFPIESITFKVRAKTGLFFGRLVEFGAIRKIRGIVVGSKLNRAGGFVPRNGYTTSLTINPVATE